MRNSRKAGKGGMAKESQGNFLVIFTWNIGAGTNNHAEVSEVSGLIGGIKIGLSYRYTGKVIFKGDPFWELKGELKWARKAIRNFDELNFVQETSDSNCHLDQACTFQFHTRRGSRTTREAEPNLHNLCIRNRKMKKARQFTQTLTKRENRVNG